MKEFVEKLIEKIKVTSLEIIVTGTKDKPYFEIKYKEVGKEDYNIGYSSYDLNNVLNWKEECFEIVNQLAEEYKDEELRKSQKIYSFIKREINPYGKPFEGTVYEFGLKVMNYIKNLHTEEYNNGWIAFTQRELDEEEKEYYGDEIKYMLDCKLPEEDEEILVTYKWKDEFYVGNDTFLREGSACYLDSGREFITEAIAWMPLPAPYQKGE